MNTESGATEAVTPLPPVTPPSGAAGEVLLDIKGLKTHFDTRDGVVKAVDEVSFSIKRGEPLIFIRR